MIYCLIFLLLVTIYFLFSKSFVRDAGDVYASLLDDEDDEAIIEKKAKKEEVKLNVKQKMLFFLIATIIFVFCMLITNFSKRFFFVSFIFSFALSYIFIRFLAVRDSRAIYRKIDFFLPIVMERLVMAVQGGSDIFTAVNITVRLSKEKGDMDPVTKALDEVIKKSEAGLSFEESLSNVAKAINLTCIKHAFLHLAMAQKEGGELIGPMEELSDSTQAYYQEVVEKEIAALPIKATLPLLCAFLGLILFFLAVPLTQLLGMNTVLK